MKWFRWYHDTAADTKHALIARRTGKPKTTVIAFWAYILETASKAADRGSLLALDLEEAAVALEVDVESLELVYSEMQIKGLISDQEVYNWDKRQPKSDSTEAERARKHREKSKITTSSRDRHGTDKETEKNTSPNGEAQSGSHPIWGDVLQMLMDQGDKESSARSFLGRAVKDYEEGALNEAISACILNQPVNAKAYLISCLQGKRKKQSAQPQKGSQISASGIKLAHERIGGSGQL